jgi:MtrB/PioB family decaheme-associated outer membrane protein
MCGGLWVLALAIDASAQMEVGGYKLDGEVRAGIQFFINEPSDKASAKFDEYRDVHNGLFLEKLRLRLFAPDGLTFGFLEGSKWGRRDQEYSLGGGRIGLWDARFDWDQTPHVYSRDTARLLATDVGRSVFVLPSPRPILPTYDGGKVIDEVGVLWQTARLSLFLTPTPNWELKGEYTRIHKEGTRAIGISYQTPMNNFAEFLEPINQLMHDFRIGGTYARETWQIQFGYAFSMFQNFRNSVTGDNPCFGLVGALPNGCTPADGAVGTLAAPSAEERGKVSLAPDNMAHTFTIAGGVSLPMRTRVTLNLSYSLRLQNDDFLQHTTTPYIAASTPGLVLPDKSLDGVTGVFLANLNVTSRPLPPLTLAFKYRIFDLHDMSKEPIFPCGVESDSRLYCDAGGALPGGPPREARRHDYTKQNAEVTGRWRFGPLASLTLGAGWEGWDRNSKGNVDHSDEPYAKAVFEVSPADWLLGRFEYRPSFKRNSNYNPNPTHIATDQSPLERKINLAERDRQQIDVLVQVTPIDPVTVGFTGTWRSDDYPNSELGVQNGVDWSVGANISWRPTERLTLSAGYVHEWNFSKQLQWAIFPGTSPPTLRPTYQWLSDSEDAIDTYHLQGNAILIPQKLDLNLGFSYAYAVGTTKTRNPAGTPSGGPAGQNLQARALRMPAIEDELVRLDAGVTYRFDKVWSLTLGYAMEMWHKKDFRTDELKPFTSGISSIFLGEDYKNYTVNIVSLVLGYRFK